MNRLKLIIIVIIIGVNSISAQTNDALGTLVTDRPDATESPSLVTKQYLQVETGSFYQTFKEGTTKTESTTYNTTLIRYGLLDNLELRLGWDFTEIKTTINNTTINNISSGFSPLLLGAKIGVANEKGIRPKIALIGHLQLPFTAATDYKPETTAIDFRFAFAHTLSKKSSLSYNLGAAWQGDNPETAYVYTIAYGYGITDTLGAYVELYGDMPENSKANHLWDAGLTYLLSNNVQLDATVGSSITKGQDILISAGFSFRVPTKKIK